MTNPLDMTGPEFLGLYFLLILGALGVAAWLRWFLRQPSDEPSSQGLVLSAYEVAYLRGGKEAAVDAAIARMVREGALGVDAKDRKLRQGAAGLPADASQLHRVIHAAAESVSGKRIGDVRSAAALHLGSIKDRLQEREFLVSDARANLTRLVPVALVLLVTLFGVVKIFVGLSRDRPVGFLFIACILSAVAAVAIFGRPVHRSQRGDLALLKLQERNAALESSARRRMDQLAGDDVALAFGLFGMGVLTGGPMAELRTAMKPPPNSSSWSSCGGSSCGGGGGGGCGGGGCGGCGS